MSRILACVDTSAYALSVCDLATWAAQKLDLTVELLHVVQRKNLASQRGDLSGAIGLGVKSELLEELTRLDEADARMQMERGKALLAAMEHRLRTAGVEKVETLHRHGGIVETILEREEDAQFVVIGKRGASHEFATDHLGSKVERVVRASKKPVLIASRRVEPPKQIVLAWDGSPAARRALEKCASSPMLADMPVHVVQAGPDDKAPSVEEAVQALGADREVQSTLRTGRPERLIAEVLEATPDAILVMGAYGHSPLRTMIVGSTTTAMMRTTRVPVFLAR